MKNALIIALGIFFTSNVIAGWEAYDFDVSYVKNIRSGNSVCYIGMTNLGTKSSDDPTICDNPALIILSDCSTDSAKQMFSLAMTAEVSGRKMHIQTTTEATYAYGCAIQPYALTLYPQAIGTDELSPVIDEDPITE